MPAAIRSFETSVITRETRRNIPEDAILQLPVGFPVAAISRDAIPPTPACQTRL
jgi:hypothetical protein